MNFLDKLSQFLPKGKSSQNQEYFFGLNIEETQVQASVWGVKNHKLEIVSTATAKYHDHDSLIHQGNLALDEALADFPIEPEKILFGIPDSWLQDDEVKPEHLKLMRRMVKEWGLTPLAYVSTTQAISHFLQKEQGAPFTGILVKASDPLEVAVVKVGKIVGTNQGRRGAHLAKDIEKALLTFTEVEVLPSKILVYDEDNFEKIQEELQSFPWMAQLPFLHLPKVENLNKNIQIPAICLAGASELYPHLNFHPKDLVHLAQSPVAQGHLSKSFSAQEEEEPYHQPRRGQTSDNIEDPGFLTGDITAFEGQHPPQANLNEEVLENGETHHPQGIIKHQPGHPGKHHQTGPQSALGRFASAVSAPLQGLSKAGAESGPVGIGMILGNKLLLFPVVLIIITLASWIFLPKANVTVFIDMRVLEKEAQVVADPNITVVDEAAKKIPGRFVEASVNGSLKGQATGKKKVGDPAKGSVLLYNKTSSPKTFSSGTVLVGPNNLNFTLDSSVNVASQSAVEGGISFGKASSNVSATDIGPEGNLSAGTELSIKNEPSEKYSAKVDQAFSGGISKDVSVVTGDDQKKLLAQLTSDLKNKAQAQIQGKMTEDYKILPEALSENIIKTSYSKKVGDQASDFNLDLTVNMRGTAYKDSDLKSIVSKLVEVNVPQNYELDLSQTETQADVSKLEKDGRLIFLAKFKAKLMPKIDQQALKKEIAFKSLDEANQRLRAIENVISSNIEIKPFGLPKPFDRIPILTQNINIEVTAK